MVDSRYILTRLELLGSNELLDDSNGFVTWDFGKQRNYIKTNHIGIFI
jgi:hypothetical protein